MAFTPHSSYAGQGGEGWSHWLGGNDRQFRFRPFAEALAFARSLGLPSQAAWHKWSSSGARPADIPSSPDATYAGQGWEGWGHWLGTSNMTTWEKRSSTAISMECRTTIDGFHIYAFKKRKHAHALR